jgi:hypothetical protein
MTAEELIKLLSELDPKTRVIVPSQAGRGKTAEVGAVYSGDVSLFGVSFSIVYLDDALVDLPDLLDVEQVTELFRVRQDPTEEF